MRNNLMSSKNFIIKNGLTIVLQIINSSGIIQVHSKRSNHDRLNSTLTAGTGIGLSPMMQIYTYNLGNVGDITGAMLLLTGTATLVMQH